MRASRRGVNAYEQWWVNSNERQRKIKNAICFLALEHEKLAHELLGSDSLRKYLASLGYRSFEKRQCPALSLLRSRMGRRYIIVDIDGKQTKVKGDCFTLVQYHDTYVVKATGSPDLNCFSPFELLRMKRTVELGAARLPRRVDGGLDIREAKRRRVWVGKNFDEGRYEAAAEPQHNHKEVRTMSGLQLLTEKYVTQLKELETRMGEVKRKLETVMEASRLLAEEGLSEDGPAVRFNENRTVPEDR
jgi:hypothetical protein